MITHPTSLESSIQIETQLRILYLEDVPNDAELVQATLTEAGLACQVVRVETQESFVAALQSGDFDLILSDKSLPSYDGLSALALVREQYPNLPFIFVTGTLGEEVAIESLKSGATDYVLKDRLARLAPVVRRALREAETQREHTSAQEALHKTERRLAHILAQAAEAIIAVNDSQRILVFYNAAEQMFGYGADEILGQPLDLLIPESSIAIHRRHLHDFARDPETMRPIAHRGELRARHKDGTEFPVEIGISKVTEGDEAVYTAMVVDLRERKRAEQALRESEHRFRLIAETVDEVFWMADVDIGNMHYISPAYERVWGRSRESLYADPRSFLEAVHVDDLPRVLATLALQKSGRPFEHEYRILRPDGSVRWIWDRGFPIRENAERVTHYTGVARDITDRKQAEVQIARRAEEFAALYETSNDLAKQAELATVLRAAVERAAELLAAPTAGLYLYDEARRDLELIVAKDFRARPGTRLQLGEGLVGHVAQTRQPARLDDYAHWAGRPPIFQDVDFRAVMALPMLFGGELIGVLIVAETAASTRTFGDDDQRLLSLFASQAASAVHNTRLLAETRQRAHEFAVLHEITLELSQQRELPVLLRTIIDRAVGLLRASRGEVYLYDSSRGDLELMIHTDPTSPSRPRLQIGEGMAGRVAQTREPLVVNDYYVWEQRLPEYDGEAALAEKPLRAVVEVPMLFGGELVGVLGVSERSLSNRNFGEADTRLLSMFAGQAASAVHNARLLEAMQGRLSELETINRASSALSASEDVDEMLGTLLDEGLAAIQASKGSIWLYDPQTDEVSMTLQRGWGDAAPPPQKRGQGIPGMVVATEQPFVSRDFRADPRLLEAARAGVPEGVGGACVPIRAESEVLGVLFANVPSTRELQPEDVHLLTTLTEIAANAIRRARARRQIELQIQRVEALRAIDTAISASLDMRVTLDVLLQHVMEQLRVDAADVLLLNPHSQVLEYTAGRGLKTNSFKNARVRLGAPYAGRVALERSLLQVPDLSLGLRARESVPVRQFAAEGFRAYYAAPLVVKGQVKGVLEVFQRAPFTADMEWLEFFQTLARQAAIAIDNAQLFEGLQRSNLNLTLSYDTTIEGWSRALDLRDKETEGHTQRVTELTTRLARAMGIDDTELVHIRRGALLHDMGKMGVPDHILLKPGPLTDDEWLIMRQHPTFAYELLSPIAYLRPALDIPYCHHEKWDGTGYPRGLKGEQIPLSARAFAIVDVWDALRSDRPYRAAWPRQKVLEHVRSLSGTHFDPQVVEVFLRMLDLD